MIVLDTNVLSELMRPEPESAVVQWTERQPRASLYLASISQAEILLGIAVLPEGKRRTLLLQTAQAMFAEEFGGRILPLSEAAAPHYAVIVSTRRAAGKPIAAFDALIAATARAAGAAVATRDVDGFIDCGVRVLNPWRSV